MCAEFNGTDVLSVRRVNDSDTAASESDVDLLGCAVVASVIGIIFKVDFAQLLERFAVVDSANSPSIISDKYSIAVRNVGNALRDPRPVME